MSKKTYFFLLIAGSLVIGCKQDEKKTVAAPVADKKHALTDPFRYHKLIEVSPGQDYDILSWGRGDTKQGSLLILHSDSSEKKYTTTTGDLDGSIIDVYNSDMDLDGNPEILVQTKTKDTTNYSTIYAYEFTNGKAQKLDFPKLTKSQKQGYHGDDNFYISEGKFMRNFPIYDGNDKNAKLTGAKRVFEYGLHGNNFTVKQLSKDSTKVKTTTTDASKPVTASVFEKKKSSGSSHSEKHHTKKHHQQEHKKKKKHHRKHHN